jgi:hypothetical protein
MKKGAALPFDEVQVGDERLNVAHFLALPLHERIRHMLAGTLTFFSRGEPVDRVEALKALRAAAGQMDSAGAD